MKNESMSNNVCISDSPQTKVMYFGACASTSAHVLNGTGLYSRNNTYYGKHQNFECGGVTYNLSAWQALWANVGLSEGGEYLLRPNKCVIQIPQFAPDYGSIMTHLFPGAGMRAGSSQSCLLRRRL